MTAEFLVQGVPAPKGSKTAFVRGGRAVLVEGGSYANRTGMAEWKAAIFAAAAAWVARNAYIACDEPYAIDVTFVMPRPANAKRRAYPHKKPDLDKLIRALLDPLTATGLLWDDARIVELVARKAYATTAQPPGAIVRVWSV